MNNEYDLQKFKEAKTILPHLQAILKVFTLTEKALTHFSMYIPVAKVLMEVKLQKSVLESYKEKYEKISKVKGKK